MDKIIHTFRSSGNKMVSGAAKKVKTSFLALQSKPRIQARGKLIGFQAFENAPESIGIRNAIWKLKEL